MFHASTDSVDLFRPDDVLWGKIQFGAGIGSFISMKAKVVVVTGAAGNLGRTVAQALGAAGAYRVLVDHGADKLGELFGHDDAGATLLIPGINLTNPADAERYVKLAVQKFGRIDALVNTVGGFSGGKPVHEESLATWEKMYSLNLLTVLHSCRAAIPELLKNGGGQIVNVAARAALTGVGTLGAYCASKSAVIRLTESIAAELKDRQVTANCILPGTIDTPQNRADMPNADFDKWVAPEAIADVILFLISTEARAISGVSLPVYGRS